MNVFLPRELEEWVEQKIQSGRYYAPSEVIMEALWLLRDRDKLREIRLEELRREVKLGFEQIDRGEYTRYASGKEFAEKIINEGMKRISQKQTK